ncbi:protein yellow-like [Cloeon dipterum]|uniref:protein yellow-like n=1 Tax=Cloeon dipterum TaxID=197152 RepID=UPI00321FE526
MRLLLLASLLSLLSTVLAAAEKTDAGPAKQRVVEVFGWSQFDFNYPSEEQRQEALKNGSFVPSAMDPTGVHAAGNRVFVCLPRWRRGVPATLAYAVYPDAKGERSPRLNPYPSWELSREGNCEGLTSVFRVFIDECNRLWAIDTGWSPSWLVPDRICPVKVMAIDLKTDKVILQYVLPKHVVKSDALPVNIQVEFPKGDCKNPKQAFLYIADTVACSIIVADMSTGDAWRVTDKTVYPNPELTTFHVAGQTFDMIDGVMGIALGPRMANGDRELYYSAMGGESQHWVKTSILRDKKKAKNSPNAFKTGLKSRQSQTAGYAMDKNGVMIFGLLNSDALVC